MASTPTTTLLTPRDLDILAALDRCPLTARQLLVLSKTFALPFTTERKVRERLQELTAAGRVRSWPLAVAGRGAPNCYGLTHLGYRLLYGSAATSPSKRYFQPIPLGRQQHAFALAEFIVHTAVAAHREGVEFTEFYRENSLKLEVGGECLFPDCAFTLRKPGEAEYHYFVELDNRTERIRSDQDADSWERKIRLYEALQDAAANRFRVLVIAAKGKRRLHHILELAGQLAHNRQRSLFYGIGLSHYLAAAFPLRTACFLDHRGRPVALLPEPQRATLPKNSETRYAPAPAATPVLAG